MTSMQRKSYSGRGTPLVKTSITLPEVLVRFAESQMANEGFPTLSSYLVHLLHSAKETDKHERAALAQAPGQAPHPVEGRPPRKKAATS